MSPAEAASPRVEITPCLTKQCQQLIKYKRNEKHDTVPQAQIFRRQMKTGAMYSASYVHDTIIQTFI